MEKAMARIVKADNGCWLYNGWHNRGYPTLARRVNGKLRYWTAHRYFYENLVGPIPKGMVIMHECDTPNCCNPDHLRLATQSDNINDMWEKKRGTSHLAARVTLDPEIKAAVMVLLKHGVQRAALARTLGVSASTMTRMGKVLEK